MKAHAIPTIFIHHDTAALRQSAAVSERQHNTMRKEIMTEENQEAQQTEEIPKIKALFQTKRIPANTLCEESSHGMQLTGHLHIQKEEDELWESWEQMQDMDIIAVTVRSEDEDEEAQCSVLNWRQSEENTMGEPATCSSATLINIEPNGDISEGPETANTSTQQDTDGEETDGSDTDDSADWRESFSQSEAQSKHLAKNCEKFQTSEVKTKNIIKLKSQKNAEIIVCDVCGIIFGNRATLKNHMRIHTEEKSYGCEVCGKRFSYKGALKIHAVTHTGEKPYSCDICGKKYTQTSSRNKHMKIHTGGKPFRGDVCSKTFSSEKLPITKKHNRSRKNLYECEVCGQSFAKSLNLKKHLNIHSTLECTLYNETFVE